MGKGGKKGAQNNPAKQEQNRQALDQLLPVVSSKIDENGGVMRISDCSQDSQVKELIQTIPGGFPRDLKIIINQWPDFFVQMTNGLVGTAMGYDTGMIRPDGTLDPAFASAFAVTPGEQQNNRGKGKGGGGGAGPQQHLDITECSDNLWRACLNIDDDAAFEAALTKVRDARRQQQQGRNAGGGGGYGGYGTYGTAQNKMQKVNVPLHLSAHERAARKEQILQIVQDLLGKSPDQTIPLSKLVADPQVRDLKKGAISKFMHWLQEFPSVFQVSPIEGTPMFSVKLIGHQPPGTVEHVKPNAKRPRLG